MLNREMQIVPMRQGSEREWPLLFPPAIGINAEIGRLTGFKVEPFRLFHHKIMHVTRDGFDLLNPHAAGHDTPLLYELI